MSSLLGLECFTFRNTGTIASPSWTAKPIGIIQDETVNLEMGLADVTTRAAKGFRLQRGTLIEGSIDLTILYDTADSDFAVFQAAFFNRTQIILAIVDGDLRENGVYQGLHSAFNVTNFSLPRPLEEAVVVNVTLTLDMEKITPGSPATGGAAPTWQTFTISA